ncbi:hypothetical protein EFS38_08755 [Dickeya undicola]|uniref:Uncharacterized protein n=1 Tax=Dickeya undicola TaxID=1577887 RepID=A0ABX9WTJ8_9GAMM|nr:hypothetical protein EFS38_08755 [Dickeya undicola]
MLSAWAAFLFDKRATRIFTVNKTKIFNEKKVNRLAFKANFMEEILWLYMERKPFFLPRHPVAIPVGQTAITYPMAAWPVICPLCHNRYATKRSKAIFRLSSFPD